MRVVWRAAARNARQRIFIWLAERNRPAAVRIGRALIAAADSLVLRSEKGRPGAAPDTRELSIVPPYVIIYEVDHTAQVVRILRIWHTAQDRSRV